MNNFKVVPYFLLLSTTLFLSACNKKKPATEKEKSATTYSGKTTLVVLGTTQDAGSPQINCKKSCCKGLFENPDVNRKVVSLGVVDGKSEKTYLFEATPNIGSQMKKLTQLEPNSEAEMVNGIFLTHAHIGHYTGLMYLGKEAMDAKKTPVYTMPRMKTFLENNGPWSQLVLRENIAIQQLKADSSIYLSDELQVTPILVPHRDEFSETVGYKIKGARKSALFIPDIDKWEKWEKDIIKEIKTVDYAFLDATFFDGEELNNRDISEIPHPFVVESLRKFANFTKEEKQKIVFIHFNHTNPLLDSTSSAYQMVKDGGFQIAQIHQEFEL